MKPARLGWLMTVCAVLAAIVRLRRGNIDGGVLWQCVLSFVAVAAASLPAPDESPKLVRGLRTATLCAFAGSLCAAPYARLPVFAPMFAASLILFVTWLAVERSGARMAWLLVSFLGLAAWGGLTGKKVMEHRRLQRLGEFDIASVHLVAQDGRVMDITKKDDLLSVIILLGAMKDFEPEDETIHDAWNGEMVLTNGRHDPISIGHGNDREPTWIVVSGSTYFVEESFDTVIKTLGR